MSLAEMALRFVISNPDVTTVIPGMRRVTSVRETSTRNERGRSIRHTYEDPARPSLGSPHRPKSRLKGGVAKSLDRPAGIQVNLLVKPNG